ncbi:MAG TPA: polyprenyl synthetase family protein, partial [Thermoplasmata archaeon]|nr:polyprenyl synthetase family protein [Thermoplasmata archaeon]
MSALATSSAEDRLESLLKPYRDRSNAHIQAIWEEFAAEHPVGAFPSSRTMRLNSRLFTAGKRYRYALALAGYQLLTGETPSRGLERAATWLEWYHLYTLFLDDIMDEDVRRRTLASAWATDA